MRYSHVPIPLLLILFILSTPSCKGGGEAGKGGIKDENPVPEEEKMPHPISLVRSDEGVKEEFLPLVEERRRKEIKVDKLPSPIVSSGKDYSALVETSKGSFSLELYSKDAPYTVSNFIHLARAGFYNGVTFHRVIPGFVAQGGDPTGTGKGGPGYKFADEFSGKGHERGSLSMANAGPDTNGSQFFICFQPQPHLNGRHSVFGKVLEGMDVVDRLEKGDVIKKIEIVEK